MCLGQSSIAPPARPELFGVQSRCIRAQIEERRTLLHLIDRHIYIYMSSVAVPCVHAVFGTRERTREENEPLPSDILRHVLKLAGPEVLSSLAPCVSKSWREVAHDPVSWRGELCQLLIREAIPAPLSLLGEQQGWIDSAATDMQGTCRHLGPRLSLPTLWLAFHGRNFLANPDFQLSRNRRGDSKCQWLSTAWVSLACTKGNHVIFHVIFRFLPALSLDFPSNQVTRDNRFDRVEWVTVELARSLEEKECQWESPPIGCAPVDEPQLRPRPYPPYSTAALEGQRERAFASMLHLCSTLHLGAMRMLRLKPPHEDMASQQQQGEEQHPGAGCLATGWAWAQAMQVVDLLGELTRRGISPAQVGGAIIGPSC